MRRFSRFVLMAFAAAGLACASTAAHGQFLIKQIQLDEKQIETFIAAHKNISAIAEKLQAAPGKPDPKVEAELEAAVKKHGFTSYREYDDVTANILLVMAGIDPATRKYTDPRTMILKEIEIAQNDKSIPEKEKKQMLEELNDALKNAQPLQFPKNIELVLKYQDKLNVVLQ